MTLLEICLIFIAGVWAGAINTIVGSGTLVTFPTLVAFGFAPRVATMSNAIGQVAGGVSGTWGYRRELAGQKHHIVQQLPASLLGAVTGAYLLLHLPATAFEKVVPVLLVLAIILVVGQPWLQKVMRRRAAAGHPQQQSHGRSVLIVLSTYLIGVYGGYFAAAQGVMLVAVMGVLLPESLQRVNALKNLLSLSVNIVAAISYTAVAFDQISWSAAGLIAAGTLCGGFIGARVGRKLPAPILRGIIVVLALVAIWRITS